MTEPALILLQYNISDILLIADEYNAAMMYAACILNTTSSWESG